MGLLLIIMKITHVIIHKIQVFYRSLSWGSVNDKTSKEFDLQKRARSLLTKCSRG